jgi:hypothetical protein
MGNPKNVRCEGTLIDMFGPLDFGLQSCGIKLSVTSQRICHPVYMNG